MDVAGACTCSICLRTNWDSVLLASMVVESDEHAEASKWLLVPKLSGTAENLCAMPSWVDWTNLRTVLCI